MFTVCVSLVLDSKCVQFWIICSIVCSIIVNTEVDPCSIQYDKHLVKPTNIDHFLEFKRQRTSRVKHQLIILNCYIKFNLLPARSYLWSIDFYWLTYVAATFRLLLIIAKYLSDSQQQKYLIYMHTILLGECGISKITY